jgi:hypothetical protein
LLDSPRDPDPGSGYDVNSPSPIVELKGRPINRQTIVHGCHTKSLTQAAQARGTEGAGPPSLDVDA